MKKLLIILMIFLSGCSLLNQEEEPETVVEAMTVPVFESSYIKYEVEGMDGVNNAHIHYVNSSNVGNFLIARDITVPWTNSFIANDDMFLYISAQNNSVNGRIVCRIYIDNIKEGENLSIGTGVVVSSCGNISSLK